MSDAAEKQKLVKLLLEEEELEDDDEEISGNPKLFVTASNLFAATCESNHLARSYSSGRYFFIAFNHLAATIFLCLRVVNQQASNSAYPQKFCVIATASDRLTTACHQ